MSQQQWPGAGRPGDGQGGQPGPYGQTGQPGGGFGQTSQPGGGFAQTSQPGGGFAQTSQPGGGFGQTGQPGGGFAQTSQPGGGFAQTSQPGGGFAQTGQPGGGFAQTSQPGGGFAQTSQPGGGFGQGGASAPYGPAQSAPLGGPAGVGKKRRGPLIAVLVSAGLVVLLVLGGVIAELVTRSGVEGELREQADAIVGETEAEGSTVAGGFLVEVHASSYLMQKLSGRFEHITMRGEGMTINGKNYDVVYDIYDLPADLKGPAGRIEVSLHVADDQFLGLVNEQASDDGSGGDSLPQDKMEIALGDGKYTVSYDAGEGYGFEGEASLAVESGKFVIKPGKQTLLLPSGNIDITTEGESNQLPTCEQESPADVEALEVDISPDGLSAKWQATGPEATLDNLGSFGLCIFE